MAFPLFAVFGSGVVAGLVNFFATKAGHILAGLGLTMIGVKSFEAFMGYVIADIAQIGGMMGNIQIGMGSGLSVPALQIMAHIGVFDFVNIIISGYMAAGSLIGMKVIYGRMK